MIVCVGCVVAQENTSDVIVAHVHLVFLKQKQDESPIAPQLGLTPCGYSLQIARFQ